MARLTRAKRKKRAEKERTKVKLSFTDMLKEYYPTELLKAELFRGADLWAVGVSFNPVAEETPELVPADDPNPFWEMIHEHLGKI